MSIKGKTYLPAYKIEVNGVNQTRLVRERLIDISVTYSGGGDSDSLSLTLDDSDAKRRLSIPMQDSDEIKIWLGYKGNLQNMGTFVVNSVSLKGGAGSADTFSIGAKAIDTSGHMFDKKYKVWRADTQGGVITLGSIISTIASEHSMDVTIGGELSEIEIEREIQRRESDISFLRFLAEKHSAALKFYNNTLIFLSKESRSVSGIPIPEKRISPTQIMDWDVTFGNRWVFKTFRAEWWDRDKAELRSETVTNPKAENDKEYIVKRIFNSPKEAKSAAKSQMAELKVQSNKLSLSLIGDPEIRPFTPIVVSNVRTHVNGTWRAGDVTHSFSNSGYTTSLSDMSEI